MRLGLFTACALALLLPIAASAQALGESFGNTAGDAFTLSVSPQYPVPNSRATVSLLSNTLDLASATMTVTVAGKQIYKGGVQPVAVPLGRAGSTTSVVVTISSGGVNYSQTLVVQPQDVVLVAEPISSAPPLYPGKPSVPLEGSVRVVAVASLRNAAGKSSSPSTYSYTWVVDGAQMGNSSGIGKQSIIVASPLQYRSRSVSVSVTSPDGALVGGASLSLAALEPSVRIYENDPLSGVRFDRALLGGYTIKNTESTLYAAPFSFPTTSGAPLVQWFLNGNMVQTGRSITLRPSGNGQGNASLSLVASSGDFAKATASLSLSFGATPSLNLFGL